MKDMKEIRDAGNTKPGDPEKCFYFGLGLTEWKIPINARGNPAGSQFTFDCGDPPTSGESILGFTGSMNGNWAMGYYSPELKTSVVLLQNNNGGEESDVAVSAYWEILKVLYAEMRPKN